MKWIPGFEDRYAVSANGEIWSYVGHIPRKLKPDLVKGYHRVTLFDSNKRTRMPVHRIVALTYILNPENRPQVNHIDGNKINNAAINLEWMTSKENCAHALEEGLYKTAVGEQYNRSDLTDMEVLQIRSVWEENAHTQKELANMFSTTRSNINNIVNRYTWKHI
jgi:hypothetical protein